MDLPNLSGTSTNCSAVDAQFPLNFQCASNEYCISVDTGSTAICCNNQVKCELLQPVSCDIQNNNATLHPDANIFITEVGQTFAPCGEAWSCCPSGYNCNTSPTGSLCQVVLAWASSTTVQNFATATAAFPVSSSTSRQPIAKSSQTPGDDSTTVSPSTASNGISSPSSYSMPSSIPESISANAPSTLPVGAKAGIGVGAGFGVIAIIAAVAFWLLRRRPKYEPAPPHPYEPQDQDILYTQHEISSDQIPAGNQMSEPGADMTSHRTRMCALPADASWCSSTINAK